jgi:hypothetical protein
MNERDIELAKKAGWEYAHGESGFEPLWKFADLIRADEREAIAAWLDGEAGSGRIISCASAAKAIRARGNT